MPEDKKIVIQPHGPYKVSGDVPLKQAVIEVDAQGTSERWKDGREYGLQPGRPYFLCRCGRSGNKPFCDGAHVGAGFDGTECAGHQPYAQGCKVHEGGSLDLYDNEDLCASMRFCDKGQGVWQAAMNSADPASRALAVEEACNCAAGRLTVREKDGTPIEPELPQEIGLIEDTAEGRRGPLWVKGGILLEGARGEAYEVRNRMTLCRCGESRNLPFCDISHMDCPHMEGFDE